MEQLNFLQGLDKLGALPSVEVRFFINKNISNSSSSIKRLLCLGVFLLFLFSAYSQNEWKPQTHLTGYVNTVAEYTDLNNGFEPKKPIGIGLSQAAFLASYKPLEKLEIKGTFVYNHNIRDIQSLLVEAYGQYTFNDAFKVGAGKYLTPLSPVNQYFYAPINPSATLPMMVSHHIMFPQSISGFQLSGELGTTMKAGYNVTYGNYSDLSHPEQGIIGLEGREDIASYIWTETLSANKPWVFLGGTGRIFANYDDKINFGLNYFDGRKSHYVYQELDLTTGQALTNFIPATRNAFGVDLELKISNLRINAEYWSGNIKTTELNNETKTRTLTNKITTDYSAYYAEAIYEKGIFTPYVRYDYVNEMFGSLFIPTAPTPPATGIGLYKLLDALFPTSAYTAGIGIRPVYEILLKLEYKYIDAKIKYNNLNIPAPLQTALPPSNPLRIQENKYNYFCASLVYSF